MRDYIKWIRSKVGNENIILGFQEYVLRMEVLLQKRSNSENIWGFSGDRRIY